jgi:hypothetical protein
VAKKALYVNWLVVFERKDIAPNANEDLAMRADHQQNFPHAVRHQPLNQEVMQPWLLFRRRPESAEEDPFVPCHGLWSA